MTYPTNNFELTLKKFPILRKEIATAFAFSASLKFSFSNEQFYASNIINSDQPDKIISKFMHDMACDSTSILQFPFSLIKNEIIST